MNRRLVLATALWPLSTVTTQAAGLADVLERQAAPMRLSSKPAMVRIVRAGDRLVAVGERGIVLLSDDDGRQWRQARVPVSTALTGVQFMDAQRGWAIGHAAVVLHTTDGGESWVLQLDGRRAAQAMQTRADELAAASAASEPAVQQAQESARLALADGPDKPLLGLHVHSEREIWVVGAYGLALASHDGGQHWQSKADLLPNPKGLHLYAIARHETEWFLAGEQGLFMSLTIDANRSATVHPTPYRGSFFALQTLPEGALLLGGLRGTLLLRHGTGAFSTLDSGTTQAIVSISNLPSQRPGLAPALELALVDQSGRVLVGTVPPAHFTTRPSEAGRRWVAVARARDGSLVGAGSTGVARLAAAEGTP